MNRKKVSILIILSLLLAGGILFILLNPVENATPTVPVAPTEEIVETTASTTGAGGETQSTETADMEPTEQAEATKPVATETPETKPTETKPVETKPVETKPAATEPEETKPTEPTGPDDYDNTGSNIGASTEPVLTGDTEYERYMNMSAAEQEAYFNSFTSPAEFFDWYNKAKQEYENSRDVIEVGPDATIDLGDIGN